MVYRPSDEVSFGTQRRMPDPSRGYRAMGEPKNNGHNEPVWLSRAGLASGHFFQLSIAQVKRCPSMPRT